MKVSDFYNLCEDKKYFSSLGGESENFKFAKAFRSFSDSLFRGVSSDEAIGVFYDSLCNDLCDESQMSYAKSEFALDAKKKVLRFVNWLKSNFEGIVEPFGLASYMGFEQTYSMIVTQGGKPAVLVVSVGRNNFSPGGRKVSTKAEYNLAGLTVKGALESTYPGIDVYCVYLSSDKDVNGEISEDFIINSTKGSNVYHYDFSDMLDEDGSFLFELLSAKISIAVSERDTSTDCSSCRYLSLCKAKKEAGKGGSKVVISRGSTYQLPKYSPSQMEVVTHKEGSMLVCAGPGSGKTACLVGRMKALIDSGIAPEFLLAISFTNAAADELSERVGSFCSENSHPTCTTINALCLRILQDNEELVGKKVKTLTVDASLLIIKEILDVMPHLRELNYQVEEGKFSYLQCARRRLEKFKECGLNKEDFIALNKGDVSDAFFDFADVYFNRVESEGYITYDEQIQMATRLLSEYPEVCGDYQALYKYVMVDEYQDINEVQRDFIYLIGGHGNLVVVGDDDQSIYGFRGGSNRYMLEFTSDWPDSKKVVIKENFRTTKALLSAAKDTISCNKQRIEKDTVAVREEGVAPIISTGTNACDVEETIKQALKQGYTYRDIAVLASTNKYLEMLHSELSVPNVLQKALLVDDPLFRGLYYGLRAVKSSCEDDVAMFHLCTLFGLVPNTTGIYWSYIASNTSEGAERVKSLIDTIRMSMECEINTLITNVACEMDYIDTTSLEAILKQVEERHIEDGSDALYEMLHYMVAFEDETKVDVTSAREEVLLITNHESKGMEFPVVIWVDDSKKTTNEESVRVSYVAMTRAKDRLFILRKAS